MPSCCTKAMDSKWSKPSTNESLSPMLLRRRLSAPETIMRKHMLAQQRSASQESDRMYHRSEIGAGSDSNLTRKWDTDGIRKNTLLRRLWTQSKPLTGSRFAGSFSEWQHSYGKLCSGRSSNSLTSIQSSPEHLVKSQSKRLLNEDLKILPSKKSPKKLPKSSSESETTKTSITTTPKTSETETTFTNTSYTFFSDNSDSAYTKTGSNFSESGQSSVRKNSSSNQNGNSVKDYVKYSANETSTQTIGTTNVNVISNVQLSQSTLDLIFSQVMRDVKNQSEDAKSDNVVQVKQIPSFYLKREASGDQIEHSRIVKCMISNVGAGSPYSKPSKPHVAVPRYSARPHTSSMEVNISSEDSTDRESDSVSLVDSLEDTSSLRTDPTQSEALANRSDISLELPDNSDKKPVKPTAFFIPIEVDSRSDFTAVSDHLPAKVRDRLARRQQKREERIQSKNKQSASRSDSNYMSASESHDVNSNHIPSVNYYSKIKKRGKSLLPSIESFRKIKIDRAKPDAKQKSVKRKSVLTETKCAPKVKNKNEKYTTKNEYVYDCGPRRIYHKTEFNNSNKRIEILEIMECVDTSEKQHSARSKSKIPVLVHQKLPKINQRHKMEKPSFLDFETVPMNDSKLDQLIANILIETLNIPDSGETDQEANLVEAETKKKYSRKFEAIPEELSAEKSDVSNNNEEKSYQGKAAVAVVKDENFSSIPKGWITFYMLHNNRGSPDSTSDEGNKDNKECKDDINVPYEIAKRKYESNENYSSSSDFQMKTIPAQNGRFKKFNQRKHRCKTDAENEKIKQPGEWSVTVSGTNTYGQCAPDLEMCLKFPDSQKNYNCPSQSDSGLGEDNEKTHFPKIGAKQDYKRLQDENEEVFMSERLPEIGRNTTRKQKRSDTSIPSLSSRIEPRQTRTSTRRYNLTRPKVEYNKLDTPRKAMSLFNDSHYAEILKRFPELLSITGNAINQEKKCNM